jgi:Ca-activated chloride channel homolog
MFRWEEGIWLLGLWGLIPLALLVLVGLYRNTRLRKRLGSPVAVNRLLPGRIYWMPRVQASLALVVLGSLCVALANPQWGTRKGPVKIKSADAYILLDISQSMLSEDVPPNRLSRAQKAAMDIVDQLKGDRVGLIVFAGNAYLQMPLSTDYAAAKLFIQSATPSQAPTQGTDVGTAIETALERFDPESARYRVLFVISDGEDHEAYTQEVIGRVVDQGVPVYTFGIGTDAGGFIPVEYQGRADYMRDESGNFIRTFFDPAFSPQPGQYDGWGVLRPGPGPGMAVRNEKSPGKITTKRGRTAFFY